MIEIFLSVIIMFLIGSIVGLFVFYDITPKNLEKPLDQTQEVIKEFRDIIQSPTKKGHLGEYIVRLALSKLPKGIVTEQFTHPDLKGQPDFAIKIGDLYLILDSKFSSVEDVKYLVKRGIELQKYNTPGLTYPFVLMWIPEPIWEKLTEEMMQKLIDVNVIPCTTSGVASTVYLVNYAMKFFDIEDKYSDIRLWLDKMASLDEQKDQILKSLGTTQTQLNNAVSNLKKVRGNVEKLDFDV